MSIIHALASRGECILAEFAEDKGNFPVIARYILKSLYLREKDENISFRYNGNHTFHIHQDGPFIYMCLTDSSYSDKKAFTFLRKFKKSFAKHFDLDKRSSAIAYGLHLVYENVFRKKISKYNASSFLGEDDSGEAEKTKYKDVKKLLRTDEILDLVIIKSRVRESESLDAVRNTRKKMRWHNFKVNLMLTLVMILVTYFLIALACGGLAWEKCFA